MILLRILISAVWTLSNLTESAPISSHSKSVSLPSHTDPGSPFPKSLTYQELQHLAIQKPSGEKSLLHTRILDFGRHPLRSRLQRYFTIQNPTNATMFAQLFVLPDSVTVEEVLQQECGTQSAGMGPLDPEEFNMTNVPPKCSGESEEVQAVSLATRRPLPPIDTFTKDWSLVDKLKKAWRRDVGDIGDGARVNWLPRLKCGIECRWVPRDRITEEIEPRPQSFFLGANSQFPIEPRSAAALGPVIFQPSVPGLQRALLIIRTNVTVVEVLELRGEAVYARLAFERETICRRAQHIPATSRYTDLDSQEMSTLSFEVSKIDITSQQILQSGVRKLPEAIEFTHIYEARNVGNYPLTVSKILIEGVSCSLMGFTVANCMERVILQPGETMAVNVTYESSFLQNEMTVKLWVITDNDAFYIPLELSIDMKDMSTLLDQQSVNKHSWTYCLCDVSMLVLSVLASGYVALILQESLRDTDRSRNSTRSPREVRAIPHVYAIPRCRSPQLQRADPPANHNMDNAADVHCEPPLFPSPVTTPVALEKGSPPRTRKVKKQKNPIIKFAPSEAQTLTANQSQELIATSRFLAKTSKQSISPLLNDARGEKPRSESQGSCTTSLDEEEQDVYLDEYKTRLGLFGGFSLAGD